MCRHALCTALLKALLHCRKVVQMCEYAGYAAAGYAAGYAASVLCAVCSSWYHLLLSLVACSGIHLEV